MSEETLQCIIGRESSGSVLEFASFSWPTAIPAEPDWPAAPGAVRRDSTQRPLLLHFAPGRWLVPQPGGEIGALLDSAVIARWGTVVDVTGKYEALSIIGPGAMRLLACGIDIESVLQSRQCAALMIFDCPSILARVPGGYAIWVQSSYITDLVTTAQRFHAPVEIPL